MEELIKLNSEEKQYCVYAHYYEDQLFYIGSGEVFKIITGLLRGRPFVFVGRSEEWFEFCNWEKDKVIVEILFVTEDEKLSFDKEEEITRMYMDQGFPLVNKSIGTRMGEEQKRKLSEANKGEKSYMWGKRGKDAPNYGSKRTLEQRKRMSEAAKRRMLNEEYKRKFIESTKGKKLSEEHKKKISEANKGKKHSEETRRKMSLAHSGENNPFYGMKHTKETRKKISEVVSGKMSGENHPFYGKTLSVEHRNKIGLTQKGKPKKGKKVLVINNKSGESKVIDSMKRAYQFIAEKGYKRGHRTFYNNINKGIYNFENYTFELTK